MPSNEGLLSRPMHFLLVEDDDDHAEIVRRSLRQAAALNTLERVRDGQEALDFLGLQLERGVPLPDVILLDLKLPKKDGHEVLAELKAHPTLSLVPVVVLTTSAATCDRVKAYQFNVNSYLVKPLDYGSFIRMIADLSCYWGVWNVPAFDWNEPPMRNMTSRGLEPLA